MRIPESLMALIEEGIIDEVLRPLMSGKEAQVFLLRCGDQERVAKVYKDSEHRTFKQRAEYTEGRKVRNTRDQRALAKGSRYGREQDEATWRATEVEMIQRLHAAGVRVPTPYHFIDGVLIMELVQDAEGSPAARLGDVELDRETALEIYDQLLREIVRMLCAGVVHGDLSDFNILLGVDGPVIIDFPQAVNAAGNQNARKLLLRDVDNLHCWLTRFVPERQRLPHAEEMWQLYQSGELTPDVKLTGRYRASEVKVDTRDLLDFVADAERDESRRRQRLGLRGGPNAHAGGNNANSHAAHKKSVTARDLNKRAGANPRNASAAGPSARGGSDARRTGAVSDNGPNLSVSHTRRAPQPQPPLPVQSSQARNATRGGPQPGHNSRARLPARVPSKPHDDRMHQRRADADRRDAPLAQQSTVNGRTERQRADTVHRSAHSDQKLGASTQNAARNARNASTNAPKAPSTLAVGAAGPNVEAVAHTPPRPSRASKRRRRRQRSRA